MSFGGARDPFDDSLTLQPIISPVTINDEFLGRNTLTSVLKNISAACRKDGKVLSKFWGDADSDSTLEPDLDLESHQLNLKMPEASSYLVSSQTTIKKGKRGRPKKQKSPTNKLQTQVHDSPENSMATIYTRSHAGSKP